MNNTLLKRMACAVTALCLASAAMSSTVSLGNNSVVLTLDNPDGSTMSVKRSIGRYGEETLVTAFTESTTYEDTYTADSDITYYHICDAMDSCVEMLSLELNKFGANTYIYRSTDNIDSISTEVNRIAEKMLHDQFGLDRYAFLFHPGDYTKAGRLNVSYYMSLSGLGQTPYETKLDNIFATCPLSGSNVTCSFWRSIENFKVVNSGDGEYMWWAVSQAAPMRRIVSERQTLFDLGKSASGGFAADCYFYKAASGWAQQQWYNRNCYMAVGTGNIGIPGWNHSYQGIEFGPSTNVSKHSDNWSGVSNPGWGAMSREETTPIIREKPFLYVDAAGKYKVFRPNLRYDSKGVSYAEGDAGDGEVLDLDNDFFIAHPSNSADEINTKLTDGKHIYFTPGIYTFDKPLVVSKPGTIILGSGYATLTATESNTNCIMIVEDVDDVTIASVLFDTYHSSQTLLRVGHSKTGVKHESQPTLLSDVIFRVGGVVGNNTNADVALEINSNNVIGDHFWIWRADHGNGVGWNKNTAKNGLVVNGDDVTIYGLFNEHFQEYQTLWNGQGGRMYFYQCETPYDVPSQDAYMSHDGEVNGWACYKVADSVKTHYASMMGMYDVFIRTGGKILIHSAVEIPKTDGVLVHHACNFGLSGGGKGGFEYVVNNSVASTANKQSTRFQVLDYYAVGINETRADGASISIWPNPATDYINVALADAAVVADIRVCDLAGRVLAAGTSEAPVSVAALPQGTYIVWVVADGITTSSKIIKR